MIAYTQLKTPEENRKVHKDKCQGSSHKPCYGIPYHLIVVPPTTRTLLHSFSLTPSVVSILSINLLRVVYRVIP